MTVAIASSVWAIAVWGTLGCHPGVVICLHRVDGESFYTKDECMAYITKTTVYKEHRHWKFICTPTYLLGE